VILASLVAQATAVKINQSIGDSDKKHQSTMRQSG
jgi:hypothetical protein